MVAAPPVLRFWDYISYSVGIIEIMENRKKFYKNFDESREISMRTVGAIGTIGSIGTMVKVEKNHENVEKVTIRK